MSRRERSLTETLLSIVLGLEAAVVFFAALVAFGLKALTPLAAFAGGGAFLVVLVIAARLVRYRWGVWFGWVLQAALLATGVILPVMFIVGVCFAAMWVYCVVRGRQLDRARADAHPDPQSPTEGER